ncbi:MAG: aconitate hydratase [Coriobacteriaceae bacterium]|jgi:aconitate hydratase|nr:aconitate hydratase [Coriobacteriaceae bacterium]
MGKGNDMQKTLKAQGRDYRYYPVLSVAGAERLPFALLVLLENVLRCAESAEEALRFAEAIVEAGSAGRTGDEIPYSPARVLLQDFTGVPVFVDFAVMREAMAALGKDPAKVNPQIPCDLVIDHSIIADFAGDPQALEKNLALEFERNSERYTFLKWAQKSFENVRIVPSGGGICHQINVEEFSQVVMVGDDKTEAADGSAGSSGSAADGSSASAGSSNSAGLAYFDTVVGTDSHTTTANGIGVLSWGVGGIEAEAAALGQPITTLVPPVIGVKLTGALAEGVSAMDVALTFAQMLRAKGVVGAFVECFGPGLDALSATQRACIANMTPEYGCTCTLFPVDGQTLDYLRLTGRSPEQVALVEAYAKAQGFWNDPAAPPRVYAEVMELDLATVEPSLAGPSRPHDRFAWGGAKQRFAEICAERGLTRGDTVTAHIGNTVHEFSHGTLAIAAVTSCTTATDPAMMVACGLLAKHAADRGLTAKPWVKCILAPGSRAAELLLERAGLADGLRALTFFNCGFGCMSCIGNSGPLAPEVQALAEDIELASVLSGNRNFEGRISPDVSQNYLAPPAAVVAYALAGTVDFDFATEALGTDAQGAAVYLKDIWPTDAEVAGVLAEHATQELFAAGREGLFEGDPAWQAIEVAASATFGWDEHSTYVRFAPYLEGMQAVPAPPEPVAGARVLVSLGDFITTDHISPAGTIAPDSPAAAYLRERGVADAQFNTYGARRGNHEVMMRGTFANVKLQNLLAQGRRGCWTYDFEAGGPATIFDTAQHYRQLGIASVVLAGKMYGSGSSRDWAAKGPALLGVRAVFAESFERIHRSNLIGMGILPLQFEEGQNAESLGLDGSERLSIAPIDFSEGLPRPARVAVSALREDGSCQEFTALVRIDTPTEGCYNAQGGILPYVIRSLASPRKD